MRSIPKILIAAVAICMSPIAHALEEHVGVNAEKGDPARWYRPADTPREKYENAMQEARAALAEALRDCRGERSTRKSCESDAREQYRREAEEARMRRSRTGD